jgi:nitrous oxide reductase accessory protein NosL
MLGFRFSDAGEGAREAWVIEYYTGQRRPAEALFYVIGSDVQGPMGRDFVPVEGRERAQRFRADHHGDRVLAWSEIDAATVQSLFRP